MEDKKLYGKYAAILAGLALLIFVVVFGGITLTKNLGKNDREVSKDVAVKELDKMCDKISVNEVEPVKGTISLDGNTLKETLPNIDKYPAQVNNTTDSYIEIFASVEKTGEGKDGWLVEVANEFNNAGITVNGKKASVRVRGLSSGMGMDYIISKKYMPDLYSPSNELWGKMIEAKNVKISEFDSRSVGNVAGILLSKKQYDKLTKKYGSVDLEVITNAVANSEITMGYTNPFASATGLNFLVSTLNTFDNKDLLSDKATKGFEKFQNNIPYVAYTTIQMRESAESGTLDGFIMEYQTYVNSPELKGSYVFTPFGVRHDGPVYEIGDLSTEKKAIAEEFKKFYKQEKYQKLATQYGFNNNENYKSTVNNIDGAKVIQAQKLWKEKKHGDKEIIAVFVADVSGSMQGKPLAELKKSLLNGSQYIGDENSIGLVTYSDDVAINLPIGKFNTEQRSLFTGAVNSLDSTGGTATFDGICIATKMLMEEKAKNPNAKLMMFVLSDGETNRGYELKDVEGILKELKIPVYTIGYNANIEALKKISNINEAASINADSEDVVYTIGNLFNAEM